MALYGIFLWTIVSFVDTLKKIKEWRIPLWWLVKFPREVKDIILREVRLNPREVKLKRTLENSETRKNSNFLFYPTPSHVWNPTMSGNPSHVWNSTHVWNSIPCLELQPCVELHPMSGTPAMCGTPPMSGIPPPPPTLVPYPQYPHPSTPTPTILPPVPLPIWPLLPLSGP